MNSDPLDSLGTCRDCEIVTPLESVKVARKLQSSCVGFRSDRSCKE